MSFGKTGDYMTKRFNPGEFWPVLNLGDFQRDYRLPAEYATETVLLHCRLAVLHVVSELSEQTNKWFLAGYNTLKEVPQGNVLNEPVLITYFTHAVFSYAKAMLFAQFASMTRKETSQSLSAEQEENQGYWLSEANKAIKAMQGSPNITVGLL